MNKLLMEENDRLQKQVTQLVYENGYYRQKTQSVRVSLSLSLIAPLPLPLPLHHLLSLPLLCRLCSSLCRVRGDVVVAGGASDHGHELRVGRH